MFKTCEHVLDDQPTLESKGWSKKMEALTRLH